jgi:tRNA1Val (adenine37-N6)-methyltransferase
MTYVKAMSSVNLKPTFNYSQPEHYHFSHDSVFLAQKVSKIIQLLDLRLKSVLDLCSGCGVVGMDLLFYLHENKMRLPVEIDFLEIQGVYQSHFIKNVDTLKTRINDIPNYSFLLMNYEQLIQNIHYKNKYDLIICNPPYFRKETGVLSPIEFKNRCRFFIDSDYPTLIKAIEYSLAQNGRAYVLLKSLHEHGISIEKEFQSLTWVLKLENLGLIRDTSLYCMTKITY